MFEFDYVALLIKFHTTYYVFLKAISISMRIWSPFITYNIIYFHNVNNIEFLSGKVYYYFYQCDFFSFLSVYESLSLINFFIFGCLYLNFIILKWFFEIIHSLCLFFVSNEKSILFILDISMPFITQEWVLIWYVDFSNGSNFWQKLKIF